MDTNRAIYGTIPRNPNPKSHPIHDTTVDRLDTWLLERIESRVHLSNSTPTRFFSPFESFSKLSQLSRSTSSSSSHARRGSIPWIPRCVVSGSIESLTRHHRSISVALVVYIPCRARNSTATIDLSRERHNRGWRKWKLRAWLHLFLSIALLNLLNFPPFLSLARQREEEARLTIRQRWCMNRIRFSYIRCTIRHSRLDRPE